MFKAIFIILSLSLAPLSLSKTKLVFAYETIHNPPFYLNESTVVPSENPGVTIELLALVAEKLDLEIEYQRYPWKRATMALEHNKIDALFHASFKESRLSFAYYPMLDGKVDPSRQIMSQAYYLYSNNQPTANWDGEYLSSNSGQIAAVTGYSIISKLKDLNMKVVEYNDALSGLRLLENGRIDGFVNLEPQTDPLIAEHNFQNVYKQPLPVQDKPYYLLFSHAFYEQNPVLAEQIWDEIAIIKNSDVYLDLLTKYNKL